MPKTITKKTIKKPTGVDESLIKIGYEDKKRGALSNCSLRKKAPAGEGVVSEREFSPRHRAKPLSADSLSPNLSAREFSPRSGVSNLTSEAKFKRREQPSFKFDENCKLEEVLA